MRPFLILMKPLSSLVFGKKIFRHFIVDTTIRAANALILMSYPTEHPFLDTQSKQSHL